MFLCSVWAVHAEILTFFVVSITECNIQCESRKIPPRDTTFFIFFTNGWEFVIDFLHTY